MLPSLQLNEIGTSEFDPFRSSIPSPWSPLSTLQVEPRGYPLHDSGPGRLARPYPVKDFHLLSSRQLTWRTPKWVSLRPTMTLIKPPSPRLLLPRENQTQADLHRIINITAARSSKLWLATAKKENPKRDENVTHVLTVSVMHDEAGV